MTNEQLALALAVHWSGRFRFANHAWFARDGENWIHASSRRLSADARGFLREKAEELKELAERQSDLRSRNQLLERAAQIPHRGVSKTVIKLAQQHLQHGQQRSARVQHG